jgi:hypothetical protein
MEGIRIFIRNPNSCSYFEGKYISFAAIVKRKWIF